MSFDVTSSRLSDRRTSVFLTLATAVAHLRFVFLRVLRIFQFIVCFLTFKLMCQGRRLDFRCRTGRVIAIPVFGLPHQVLLDWSTLFCSSRLRNYRCQARQCPYRSPCASGRLLRPSSAHLVLAPKGAGCYHLMTLVMRFGSLTSDLRVRTVGTGSGKARSTDPVSDASFGGE